MIENMNMTDAIISIIGTQKDPSGETDRVELVTAGQYGYENGESRFCYMESDITGLSGTETSFTISPLGVVMSRKGSLNSELVFQPGKKHFFLYETPYGSATMGVDTRALRHSMNEHGGELELDYDINFEHSLVGRNQFKINVKENKQYV